MFDHQFKNNPFSNISLQDVPGIFFGRYLRPIGMLKNYFSYALLCMIYIQNFQDVALLLAGKKSEITMNFRGGSSYTVNRQNFKRVLYLLLQIKKGRHFIKLADDFGSVSFSYRGRRVFLAGPDSLGLAYDVFLCNEYALLDVNGKMVVDIGANIADTAICFALSGAKKVIAFEPYPYSYNFAVKNIRLNGLSQKITLSEAAVGAKRSHIILDEKGMTFGGSQLSASKRGKKVPIVTLADIVRDFKIDDGRLKVDCEGFEYDIVLGAEREVLRKFSGIILEYHYGHANLVEKLLTAGFDVRLIKRPSYFFHKGWGYPHARTGILEATRRD